MKLRESMIGSSLTLKDMMDTLEAHSNGAALAANQIGVLRRLIVINYCGNRLKLINPEIVSYSGLRQSTGGLPELSKHIWNRRTAAKGCCQGNRRAWATFYNMCRRRSCKVSVP